MRSMTDGSSRWLYAAGAALGLTAATVLIAMAGRAPLSHGARINAASARAPITGLFVLLLGAGVIALAGLAVMLAPSRRRRDDLPQLVPRGVQSHWIWKLLSALLLLALGAAIVLAGVLGSKHSAAQPIVRLRGIGAPARTTPTSTPSPAGQTGFALPTWLPWTLAGIVAIAAIALVTVLLLRRRRSAAEELPERRAARSAVDAAISALGGSDDPRGAVIAAYAAMERTFAERGVPRSEAEAPREYLQRALAAATGAGDPATTAPPAVNDARTLTQLFEEARFSEHPIPERLRELARTSLHSLRTALGAADVG